MDESNSGVNIFTIFFNIKEEIPIAAPLLPLLALSLLNFLKDFTSDGPLNFFRVSFYYLPFLKKKKTPTNMLIIVDSFTVKPNFMSAARG